MGMRLDRLLSELSPKMSRKQCRDAIRAGRVTADGTVVRDPERKTDPETETVALDGMPFSYARFRYFLLNKPAGVLSASRDKKQRTVLDLIPEIDPEKYFPVGRLDIDTEGFLLITNDGAFAHELLSPKKHVPKTYHAVCRGVLTEEDCAKLSAGVDLGDFVTAPAKACILQKGDTETVLVLTITEGKFHQVKRMVQAVGGEVTALRRVSMGGLSLPDDLPAGHFIELTTAEIARIRISEEN